jgi:O-antigen/teichoic acid export membrane protein
VRRTTDATGPAEPTAPTRSGHEAEGPAVTASALGTSAARGAAFLSARSVLVQLFQVVSSVLLARELVPELYGAFALGATLVGFGRIVGDCGAGNAMIQATGDRHLNRQALQAVHFLQLAVFVGAAFILALSAPSLRTAFDGPPETVTIVYVMSLALLIEAPAVVPRLRLMRDLKFKQLASISVVASLSLYTAQILGLVFGLGVWALVLGQVVTSVVSTGLTLAVGGGTPPPSPKGSLAMFRSGIAYQGTAIAMGCLTMPSVAIVGAVGGADILGLWTWSTVLVTPLVTMVHNVHEIAFPTLARLHEHRRSRHADAVVLVARSLSLVIGAAVGILAGFATPIVRIVFDPRWLPAVGAVRLALFGGIAFSLTSLLAAAVQTIGRPGIRLRSYLVGAGVGLALLVPLVEVWGATGAALATSVVVQVVDLAILLVVSRVRLYRAFLNLAVVTPATFVWSLVLAARVDSFGGLLVAGIVAAVPAGLLVLLTDRRALLQSLSFLQHRPSAARPDATAPAV